MIISRAVPLCLLVFIAGRPAPARSQDMLELRHSLETRRLEVLTSFRSDAALRLLGSARELQALDAGDWGRLREVLDEIQSLTDSLAYLDGELAEAIPAAEQARDDLLQALERALETARRAVREVRAQDQALHQSRIQVLERRVQDLRAAAGPVELIDPLAGEVPLLRALAEIVARERAREAGEEDLREELRVFLGTLRLFDETGLPPGARTAGEGSSEAESGCGCGIPVVEEALPPTDISILDTEAGEDVETRRVGGGEVRVTSTTLARLEAQLREQAFSLRVPLVEPVEVEGVSELHADMGLHFTAFRGGESDRPGFGAEVTGSVVLSRVLGSGTVLRVEPRLGLRSSQFSSSSHVEMVGEMTETLGRIEESAVGWSISAYQMGRYLSDSPPLPGSLEPTRGGAGLLVDVALPVTGRWFLRMGGRAESVRYGSENWSALDRRGGGGTIGVVRARDMGSWRIAVTGNRTAFPSDSAAGRRDSFWKVGTDWADDGRMSLRVSLGAGRNHSSLPAFDFRSGSASVQLSASLGATSLQGYGALAFKSYDNPGPSYARVAPSDQDSGTILALQLSAPIDAARTVRVKLGWSRSETGFRDLFFQRVGVSLHLAFRGMGAG